MVHLFDVAAAKLFPTSRDRARTIYEVLHLALFASSTDRERLLLRDSARPQPVDQKPGAVAGDSYARFSFTLAGGTFVLISLLAANKPFAYTNMYP